MAFTTVAIFMWPLIIKLSCFPVAISALSSNHYDKTCPDVENIVRRVITEATSEDNTVPATLLRMHFHDCFIRGCDGSVLLESKGGNKAERDGAPNKSLHAFYVIQNAKKAVEAVCPQTVSCADILAFSARDSVVLSGGPKWEVAKGRKDGKISRASETAQLPSPLFNISQLQQSFALRGLSLDDLVALTGAHTLGFSHCSSFMKRIYNFNSSHDIDPTLRPSFAATLRNICPVTGNAKNGGGIKMDPSSTSFDTTHYKLIIQGKTLFASDQALLTTPKTKSLVYKFATSKKAFHTAFANSMIKMSSINGGQEIRKDCRFVN